MKQLIGFQRGVNLGGWMSHEHYEPEHLASFIHEEDIARIASWGLDHVRLPVDYNLFESQGAEEPLGFHYVDLAATWCRKHGLNLILDLHKTAGFSYEETFGESGFFDSERYQQQFYDLWDAFARRYGSDPEHIAFELLNEVTERAFMPSWNRIVAKAVQTIRVHAPRTWILVGSYGNNAVEALPALEMPSDDRLVYNFHCYDPLGITHQGAYWIKTMHPDFRLPYPCTRGEYRAAIATMQGFQSPVSGTDEEGFGTEFFMERFAEAVALSEKHDIPLYCGEYGVIDLASDETAVKWYRDVHAAFERCGIARAAWSYKGMDFGLLDRPDVLTELLKNL